MNPASEQGLPLVEAAGAVLRKRRFVIGAGILCAFATGIIVLVMPRTYTATATFTPQATRTQIGALGGIAAQFGLVLPGTEGNQSPAFYADLLRARTILEPVVQKPVTFTFKGEPYSGSFLQFSKPPGRDSAQRMEEATRRLREAMDVTVQSKTGIVRVDTKTRYPGLSAFLTREALEQINLFNIQTRRSQARSRRQFLEERMRQAGAELQQAEEALSAFSQQNRAPLMNSPVLQTRHERLSREVNLRNQVYTSLAQAAEQAKLDEIQDTPLITIIEAPQVPASPDRRGLINKTILAFLAGVTLSAFGVVAARVMGQNRRSRPETYEEFSAALLAAKEDMLRVVWPFRRAAAGNGRSTHSDTPVRRS